MHESKQAGAQEGGVHDSGDGGMCHAGWAYGVHAGVVTNMYMAAGVWLCMRGWWRACGWENGRFFEWEKKCSPCWPDRKSERETEE
nr:hypothetical protein Iba_chr11fCG10370 [Ipomoea batatas]